MGSAKTGEVWYLVPEHFTYETIGLGGIGAMGEGVTADAEGNVYGGEIGPAWLRGITKYELKLSPNESP